MTEFFQTQLGRKFYEADFPRAVAALERIADALAGGAEPAPALARTSTAGPVSVTVRGVRITVELPTPPEPEPAQESEERCFSTTYRAECEGTGHHLCKECANRLFATERGEAP